MGSILSRDVVKAPLVLDACIAIDLLKIPGLLGMVAQFYDVRMHSIAVGEVTGLTASACRGLGITVVDPQFDRDRTSLDSDSLSMELAEELGAALGTNDLGLRKQCVAQGIHVVGGLGILLSLVRFSAIDVERAKGIVCVWSSAGDFRIANAVVSQFEDELESFRKGKGRRDG